MQYLDWRIDQGRPYYRVKTSRFDSYMAARRVVSFAFAAKAPLPLALVGAVAANDLPACIEDWPETLQGAYRKAEATRAGRVKAAIERERNKDKYIARAKARYKLEKSSAHLLPKPIPVPNVKARKQA